MAERSKKTGRETEKDQFLHYLMILIEISVICSWPIVGH